MAQKRSLWFYLAVVLVILSTLTQEAEARRKILRGRRVMTRTYYHGNAVPAWAISLMAGIGHVTCRWRTVRDHEKTGTFFRNWLFEHIPASYAARAAMIQVYKLYY
ncbi:hypothetical protein SFRURICE_011574 [Spodoptera frugiperda]|nr:hypothetical protein SFRURICE_011574 [Spodoptera frugiperda]